MARSTHFIQTSMCCCCYYSMKFLLDERGTLLNLSLKCIPWLAWDRFKKVDSKCNEWGYLDPKFGLICNYCHYSRVNIWNAMIVMMIMMATSCGDVITASRKIWNILKDFVIQKANTTLFEAFLSLHFHSNLLFCSIFSSRRWRKYGHLMEKWQDVSRGEEGPSGTPRQLTTGSATVSDLTHDLNVKMAGMI